jgi:hypothetical protein
MVEPHPVTEAQLAFQPGQPPAEQAEAMAKIQTLFGMKGTGT